MNLFKTPDFPTSLSISYTALKLTVEYQETYLQHILRSWQQGKLGVLIVWILHCRSQGMNESWNNVVSNNLTLCHELLLRRLVAIGPTGSACSVDQLGRRWGSMLRRLLNMDHNIIMEITWDVQILKTNTGWQTQILAYRKCRLILELDPVRSYIMIHCTTGV